MWQSKITDATVRQEIGGRILSVAPPPRLGLNPDLGSGMKPVIESDLLPISYTSQTKRWFDKLGTISLGIQVLDPRRNSSSVKIQVR